MVRIILLLAFGFTQGVDFSHTSSNAPLVLNDRNTILHTKLRMPSKLESKIVGAAGLPVCGAQILMVSKLSKQQLTQYQTSSDSNGIFEWQHSLSRPILLVVIADGYEPHVSVCQKLSCVSKVVLQKNKNEDDKRIGIVSSLFPQTDRPLRGPLKLAYLTQDAIANSLYPEWNASGPLINQISIKTVCGDGKDGILVWDAKNAFVGRIGVPTSWTWK